LTPKSRNPGQRASFFDKGMTSEKPNFEAKIEFTRPFCYFVLDMKRYLLLVAGVLKVPEE